MDNVSLYFVFPRGMLQPRPNAMRPSGGEKLKMRQRLKHTKRSRISGGLAVEVLESRTFLDGSGLVSDLPPVPEVDFSRPIDLAFLEALGDDLHTLSGDGDAGPWKEQWVEKLEVDEVDAEGPVVEMVVLDQTPIRDEEKRIRVPDLSWLDDGSGDGLTDGDIYDFSMPSSVVGACDHIGTEVSDSTSTDHLISARAILSSTAAHFVWVAASAASTESWWALDASEGTRDVESHPLSACLLADMAVATTN